MDLDLEVGNPGRVLQARFIEIIRLRLLSNLQKRTPADIFTRKNGSTPLPYGKNIRYEGLTCPLC